MTERHAIFMQAALRLAMKGCGQTSPNPMVGAVLTAGDAIIGKGWHHAAGMPHAEIEAIRDAVRCGHSIAGATLYVTLEPCCTHGRTPPCTQAIIDAKIKKVVVAASDPNPKHSGRGFDILKAAGIEVVHGILADKAARMNEAFNHWIVHRTPFVTVKAAMTLDGKIATAAGESKWITGEQSRLWSMQLRKRSDAILTGINTILADDPSLTCRDGRSGKVVHPRLRRIILDSHARIPPGARVLTDEMAGLTTIVVTEEASDRRLAALAKKAVIWQAPAINKRVDLQWLMRQLGELQATSLLVEGGGEINGSFIGSNLVHRVAFFFAPIVLGGRSALKGVAGNGFSDLQQALHLEQIEWKTTGKDLHLTALAQCQKGQSHNL